MRYTSNSRASRTNVQGVMCKVYRMEKKEIGDDMAEERSAELSLVDEVNDLLKKETWTRTSIGEYTTASLRPLRDMVQKARDGELTDEVLDACNTYLVQNKMSVPALYISGMLTLGISLDQSKLIDLVGMFQRNHKKDIVETLCMEIIEKDDKNQFALRTLANCYKEEGKGKEWPLYEKIVKLDFAEADAAYALGDHYKNDNEERAIDYYKTALVRYTKAQDSKGVKDAWKCLVSLIPEDIDFFLRTKRDIAKFVGSRSISSLLQELYNQYKGKGDWDVCIKLLKQMLEVDPSSDEKRKEIVECYRGKYEGKDRLEEYIRASNLTQSYRNVFEAINDFEKHMAFNTKTYVWHKTWGVGRITAINGDMLHINFGKKRGSKENETHDLSLKTAVNILTVLSDNHFWVKKATTRHDDLRAYVMDNMEDALKTIIESFDNRLDMKRIKQELVPSILSPAEWTSWHTAAKKILETSPSFGVDPVDATKYIALKVAAKGGSNITDEFWALKQLPDRVNVLLKFVRNMEADKANIDEATQSKITSSYEEMTQYFKNFMSFMQPKSNADEGSYREPSSKQVEDAMVSWLTLHETFLIRMEAASNNGQETKTENRDAISQDTQTSNDKVKDEEAIFAKQWPFTELFSRVANVKDMYLALKDTSSVPLRTRFIKAIKDSGVPDWDKQYVLLFPVSTDSAIIAALEAEGKESELTSLTKTCVDGWKDNRNGVICLFRDFYDRPWFKAAGVPLDKWLIVLTNIIDLTFREIDNHVNTTENKKTNKAATTVLFKPRMNKGHTQANGEKVSTNGVLVQYILDNDEEAAKRMFTLINDIKDIDPSYKALIRSRILEKFNDFVFPVTEEKVKQQQDVMYVTAKRLEEKKAEAERIQSVEIPNNAAEISEARRQGDLKENAEYKAAKEAQHRLNERLSQLNSELSKAVIFDPATITTALVGFSTEVTLHNAKTGADEVMKIFGPWESDPDNGIISYLSPLGTALMDKKVGEKAGATKVHDFSFYTVKDIRATSL